MSDQVAWLDALYTFTGADGFTQDIILGAKMIQELPNKNAEATWLANHIFAKWQSSLDLMEDIILAEEATEPTPGFAAYLLCTLPGVGGWIAYRDRSIRMGCIYAMAQSNEDKDVEVAVRHGNRYAIYRSTNDDRALKLAVDLGSLVAQNQYLRSHMDNAALAMRLIRCKQESNHAGWSYLQTNVVTITEQLAFGELFSKTSMENIGSRCCKACTRVRVFRAKLWEGGENLKLATRLRRLYVARAAQVRAQVVMWVLCAKRVAGSAGHPFCKDIRNKIAKLIWEARLEAPPPPPPPPQPQKRRRVAPDRYKP